MPAFLPNLRLMRPLSLVILTEVSWWIKIGESFVNRTRILRFSPAIHRWFVRQLHNFNMICACKENICVCISKKHDKIYVRIAYHLHKNKQCVNLNRPNFWSNPKSLKVCRYRWQTSAHINKWKTACNTNSRMIHEWPNYQTWKCAQIERSGCLT